MLRSDGTPYPPGCPGIQQQLVDALVGHHLSDDAVLPLHQHMLHPEDQAAAKDPVLPVCSSLRAHTTGQVLLGHISCQAQSRSTYLLAVNGPGHVRSSGLNVQVSTINRCLEGDCKGRRLSLQGCARHTYAIGAPVWSGQPPAHCPARCQTPCAGWSATRWSGL